ncbi:MAG: hypothetical protein KKC76_20295 [Proteobacteria bacterium]|nr:hypothetical protein [Pseudomonadota bacterium]MBU4294428.1 hypothetical protein [Pseudomonadota bacterium]MCG2747610.1 hypothetical protein [Desulfobulbaceae bacterium]
MLRKKLQFILRQPEFPFLLFFFSLFLFVTPFKRNADKAGLEATFIYLFLAWAVICLLLFFLSREYAGKQDNINDETDEMIP